MCIILDPAPADGYFEEVLTEVDLIIPNQQETERITGIKIETEQDAREAAEMIYYAEVKEVIITMVVDGCLYSSEEETLLGEAMQVRALNTVGVGDTFAGALVQN